MFPFHRTIWSTSDAADEANPCALWEGHLSEITTFSLEVLMDVEAVGALQVTPQAHASNDGTTWTDAEWVGDAPGPITDNTVHVVGPFEIDRSHGKRLVVFR